MKKRAWKLTAIVLAVLLAFTMMPAAAGTAYAEDAPLSGTDLSSAQGEEDEMAPEADSPEYQDETAAGTEGEDPSEGSLPGTDLPELPDADDLTDETNHAASGEEDILSDEEGIPADEEDILSDEEDIFSDEEDISSDEDDAFSEEESTEAKNATSYGIWVKNEEVTSDHTSGSGWRYEASSNTLYLNNFSYSGDAAHEGSGAHGRTGVIYSDGDLTLNLSGTNTAVSTQRVGGVSCGIYTKGFLTINGSGKLTVKGPEDAFISSDGIFAEGGMRINSGTIDSTGKSCGIDVSGAYKLEIYGGNVTVGSYREDNYHYGIFARELYVYGGTLTATSLAGWGGFAIYAPYVYLYGGTVNAYGGYKGIYGSYGEVIINGAVVNASSGQYGIDAGGSLLIDGSVVTLSGSEAAINKAPSLVGVDARTSPYIDGSSSHSFSYGEEIGKWFHTEIKSYDLYVAGTRVTGANAHDLTKIDGVTVSNGGSASFDYAKLSLVLDNATIVNRRTSGTDDVSFYGVYYAGSGNFTINASGNNAITGRNGSFSDTICGVRSNSTNLYITLQYGASLNVTGGNNSSGGSCGISENYNLEISGKGTLNASGGSHGSGKNSAGLSCYLCSVADSTLNANSSSGTGAEFTGSGLTLNDGANVEFSGTYGVGITLRFPLGISSKAGTLTIRGTSRATTGNNDAYLQRSGSSPFTMTGYQSADAASGGTNLPNASYTNSALSSYKKLVMIPEFVDYPLWVGTTRINTSNADDLYGLPGVTIAEGGEAEFTPATGDSPATLTLKDFTYSGEGHTEGNVTAGIYYSGSDQLVIKTDGQNAVTQTGGQGYGIYTEKGLTIVSPGTLIVTGGSQALNKVPTLTGLSGEGSANADGSDPERYESSKNNTYKWFRSYVESYPLIVGNVTVDTSNAANVLGDTGTPTVTYDHATRTLTLNNASIKGTYDHPAIESRLEDLTIVLTGASTIKEPIETSASGIGSKGDLTIKGTGSVEIQSRSWGISSNKSLNIIGGTICTYDGVPTDQGPDHENSAFQSTRSTP